MLHLKIWPIKAYQRLTECIWRQTSAFNLTQECIAQVRETVVKLSQNGRTRRIIKIFSYLEENLILEATKPYVEAWTIDATIGVFDCPPKTVSSPNPNFSKPSSRTANLDFWSGLTHQLLGRLRSTIPNLQIYLPKKVNCEKLGLGIDNPWRMFFFFFEFADEQVLGEGSWTAFLDIWSLQLCNDTKMSLQLEPRRSSSKSLASVEWGCPNTSAPWGAQLGSYQLSHFSFVTPDVRVWRWLPLELFFIGLFDRYYHWKNEEEKLTSALGIELQSPDAFSNA